jgi:hypothetical protein
MSEAEQLKKECMAMAVAELEQLMNIIGDLGYRGYRVSICRLKGYSYGQCAQNLNISKSLAQWYWESCQKKGYDIVLKQIFKMK